MATNSNKTKLKTTLSHSVNSVRLLACLFLIGMAVLQYLYNKYLPSFNNPAEARWLLNGTLIVFLISMFFINYSSKQLDFIALTLYVLVISYGMFLTIVNQFHHSAVTVLIFIMIGGTIIMTNILFYSVQSAIIAFIVAIYFFNYAFNEVMLLGIFNILISIVVCGTVLFVRLRMIEEVRFSNSLLKKVQMFSIIAKPSGQISFVSPSVKSILGYESQELLNNGWWENSNLSKGWIQKEYILNYPAIIPQEIKSIENSITSRDGNLVWLSWTTSILPDGNYMGVAFDITKYKTA
jgi:PAS domain S-box-containing protein